MCSQSKCSYEILGNPCTAHKWKRVFLPPHMPAWWWWGSMVVVAGVVLGALKLFSSWGI